MNSKSTGTWVATYGMLIGLAFIFSYVEAIIPIPIPIPGVKLGLANLVTIVGLYTVGVKGTVAVSLIRIVLVGFTFGNASSMIYSLAGGGLSLILMILAKKLNWFSQIGVSIIGGIGHNIGQISIAALVVQTAGVFYYLPFLMVAGVVAGAVVGLLGGLVTVRIRRFVKKADK
ncbi:MAG: Gx transporter family protein [Hungatella sp.]|nr:Gx transporter family protein [Hungatella sp.]MCI9502074.1 Gx transporter family protein [Hungatella sp.]